MSTAESIVQPAAQATELKAGDVPNRRADIEAKQAQVAALLGEAGCPGLLVLEPENFSWLTGGATARGIPNPADLPVLYFSPDQRWLLSSNVDSQRLFDEELDGLGFQLKEWPWHWGRAQLLADLCQGRRLACDRPLEDGQPVADKLRKLRRILTPYEQSCLRVVGGLVSHALEATCRTLAPRQTEREAAGQLSHRLLHRGADPLVISVAADGRSRTYRQCGFTDVPIRHHAVLFVTARKYGVCASAARSVCFGQPETSFAREHDAACKIHTTYLASTWPDGGPKEILGLGRRVYTATGYEHEWLSCPQGHITGHAPVELALLPQTEELFKSGWAVTWRVSVGAACSCDTYLITDKGAENITPIEVWPQKRIRIQGADFLCPFLLERSASDDKRVQPPGAAQESGGKS